MIHKTDIEARIKRTFYQHISDSTTTIAHVTLDNGFSVVGTSAAADPAEFDAGLGRKYAREDAIEKLFPHFAFLALETEHHKANNKSFGMALRAMKEGKFVRRATWKPGEYAYLKNGVMKAHFFNFGAPVLVDYFSPCSGQFCAEDWTIL